MNLQDYKEKALKDPKFKKEYERFDLLLELELAWLRFKIWFLKHLP